MPRNRLPNRRACDTMDMNFSGIRLAVTWSRFADGRLAEVFLAPAKAASPFATACRELGLLMSLLLQGGVGETEILHSLCEDAGGEFDGLGAAALRMICRAEGGSE